MTNRRMFLTMLRGAMLRRRSRAVAALGSSTVGAATLFCLAAVCLAVPAQMSAQMRQFGANLIVVPASRGAASDQAARISAEDVAVLDQAVSSATTAPDQEAGEQEQGLRVRWRVSGVVDTGGQEDDILYVPTAGLEELTGSSAAGFDVVEYSVDTTAVTVEAAARDVEASGSGDHVQAKPVTRMTSGDERVITMLNTLFWMVAVVASVPPVRRASRIDPALVLREE
ncbi:MAG: hypothetical protein Q4C85_02860 [Actinomyces sp.]|uniref:hypothetical protein n=1 Tax=Actinomyces sp. TaxID=29317 RepID=UPI0026DAE6BA|nr:hypothetical protein [Actinomyces sp.]MDO4242695.1 hypothetical protein [Actinomyces sp.]